MRPKDDLKVPRPLLALSLCIHTWANTETRPVPRGTTLCGQWWWGAEELGPQRRGQGAHVQDAESKQVSKQEKWDHSSAV